MNGPDWDGAATRTTAPDSATLPAMSTRRGIPKPPPEIWADLENAGGTDTDRYRAAHGRYVQWLLAEHGISEGLHGNTAPREAFE